MKNNTVLTTFLVITLIAFIFERTVINFPFVFLIGSFLSIVFKRKSVFILVFVLAFITDSLRVSNFGLTALFIFSTMLLITLYEKYSGSDDYVVAGFIVAAVTVGYAYVMSYSVPLVLGALGLVLLGMMGYEIIKKNRKSIMY